MKREWSWVSDSEAVCLSFEQKAPYPVVPTNNKLQVVFDSKGSVTEYSLIDTIELPGRFEGKLRRDDAILLAGFFVEPANELLAAPAFDAKKCFAVPSRLAGKFCDTKLVARSGWRVQFEPELPIDLLGKAEQHGVVIDAQDGSLLSRYGL